MVLTAFSIVLAGFPPIQGMEPSSGDQSVVGILETAMKLASEEDEDSEDAKKVKLCATQDPRRESRGRLANLCGLSIC